MATKLFIGGLAWATTDESLRSAFEKYGDIDDAVVIKDRESGRSRGFGFVTFSELAMAESAMEGMNEQELEGRTIRVDKAGEPSRRNSGGRFQRDRPRYGGRSSRPYNSNDRDRPRRTRRYDDEKRQD